MAFDVLSPDVCASLACNIFSKESEYYNKTIEALGEEIFTSLLGTPYKCLVQTMHLYVFTIEVIICLSKSKMCHSRE